VGRVSGVLGGVGVGEREGGVRRDDGWRGQRFQQLAGNKQEKEGMECERLPIDERESRRQWISELAASKEPSR